jgi:hypothetical protein
VVGEALGEELGSASGSGSGSVSGLSEEGSSEGSLGLSFSWCVVRNICSECVEGGQYSEGQSQIGLRVGNWKE